MADRRTILPDFCNIWSAFILVLLSELLALLLTLAAAPAPERFWPDLGLRSIFIVWIAIASAVVLCALGRPLARLSPAQSAVWTFVVIQCIVALAGFAVRHLFPEVEMLSNAQTPDEFHALRHFSITAIVTAVWLRYLYVQFQWRIQVKSESSAKLEALQARMRPHFLFNSLNAIASLTQRNPAKAEELVLDLAELFRVVIKKNFRLSTLEEELHLTQQYLNIEQQRLGDRLKVIWDIDSAPKDALIPPLSLQPLVENAVYHGIEPMSEGGAVQIQAQLRRREIMLMVRNPMISRERIASRQGNREALQNLRQRLENCFPGEGQILTSIADNHFQARIVIPYRTKADENSDRR